ncbi:MAG: phosphotyrosine protein phosphatase [Lachnospiraceae bacterium]|nr:phosphotyrosine protein phosphatase [Lachnospiraceae bacterium]MDD7076986.1 phosphotyrosine protein phosphatase [Lachnospiraceae bacterium]MDY3730919.1 phosphotyrosine protein phosphatase [Candidatus Choladocola sp.]
MRRYDRLIFVSNSDTAVGPMAEAILQSKYLLEELAITSKGVVVLFPEPINPKAEAVLVSNGLTMKEHMSDPLVREDFGERTLILATSESVKQKVLNEIAPEDAQVRTLHEYVGEEQEVTNPYGGALADYGQCFAQLEALITKLVVQLNEQELLSEE